MHRRNNKLAALVVGLGLLSLLTTAKPAGAAQNSMEDCMQICAPISDCSMATGAAICAAFGCNQYEWTCSNHEKCPGYNQRQINCWSYVE